MGAEEVDRPGSYAQAWLSRHSRGRAEREDKTHQHPTGETFHLHGASRSLHTYPP